uniref:F-box domain-containing protein n=1 Tax=Ditylenchus dipsaci TaxID=166011 RepID=A0A915DMF9_9BILA
MQQLSDDLLVELMALLPRRCTALVFQVLNRHIQKLYLQYTSTFHWIHNLTIQRLDYDWENFNSDWRSLHFNNH